MMRFPTIQGWYNFVEGIVNSRPGNELHFAVGELEDVVNKSRNNIIFPLVFCEGFQSRYLNNKQKEYDVSYSVFNQYKNVQDRTEIINTIAQCEEIGDEVLRQIRTLSRKGTCVFSVSQVDAQPVMHEGERIAGVRYSFTVNQHFPNANS